MLAKLLASVIALCCVLPVQAQTKWPERPVRVIVGLAPGAMIDKALADTARFAVCIFESPSPSVTVSRIVNIPALAGVNDRPVAIWPAYDVAGGDSVSTETFAEFRTSHTYV